MQSALAAPQIKPMNELSWTAIKRIVYERANRCCEYCQTCEKNIGQPMHIEHILPSGGDTLDNLCLSCASCNLSKALAVTEVDPITNTVVSLFNPRTQLWNQHFRWIEGGLRLDGLTATGRATIIRLKINQERMVAARSTWLTAGVHPPKSE